MTAKIDWSYHRPGCKTCAKTQDFLTAAGVSAAEQINVKQTALGADEALALARSVEQIFATRGKNVVHVDLRGERPDEAALKKLLLGPTGNLRAPTLRVGGTLLVGFDRDTYAQVLG